MSHRRRERRPQHTRDAVHEVEATTPDTTTVTDTPPTDPIASRMAHIAATTPGWTYLDAHEPSFWLRCRLNDLQTRASVGQLHQCEHLRPGMRAAHFLWLPDWLLCRDCIPRAALDAENDRRCDRCGLVVPAGTLSPHTIALPAVVVAYGVCPGCHQREVPDL